MNVTFAERPPAHTMLEFPPAGLRASNQATKRATCEGSVTLGEKIRGFWLWCDADGRADVDLADAFRDALTAAAAGNHDK
jgi:hypothetical protein